MEKRFRMRQVFYQGVQLKKGIAKRQFDEVVAYLMALPEDDILYGFRKRAGLPCPGSELGGWYSNDGSFDIYDWDEIFNTFGQWLSFFAKAYVITGSEEVYQKLSRLVHEWGKTIEEDGYFFYSWNNNAHHYSYEKIMTGLTDAYSYGKVQEAEQLLFRITEWAKKNLPTFKNRADERRATFTGGERSIKCIDNEWYTLPENLYRAYLATGEETYKEFAGKWHYDVYWEAMRSQDASFLKGVHGYSHVNTLCSAAMAYQMSGDLQYLKTIKSAYEVLQKYQVIASGGFAFDEHMADMDGSNYQAVEEEGKSFEAACGSYAVLKLTRYLLLFTGEAKYADWAEKVLYNALFAVLPMKDDGQRRGKTFYYADYRIGGGRKVYYEHSFPCCSGTYPQAVAEYHNIIYFVDEDSIYIAQYLPSTFRIQGRKEETELEINGNYPREEEVEILFKRDSVRKLKLRIPSWIKESAIVIKINEKEEWSGVVPGEWLEVGEGWKAGDKIVIRFPMHLYTLPITEEHRERAALMYGPVMLAAKGKHKRVLAQAKMPENYIKKEEGQLRFLSEDGKLEFLPYWEYGEKEWYSVYLDYVE